MINHNAQSMMMWMSTCMITRRLVDLFGCQYSYIEHRMQSARINHTARDVMIQLERVDGQQWSDLLRYQEKKKQTKVERVPFGDIQ